MAREGISHRQASFREYLMGGSARWKPRVPPDGGGIEPDHHPEDIPGTISHGRGITPAPLAEGWENFTLLHGVFTLRRKNSVGVSNTFLKDSRLAVLFSTYSRFSCLFKQ